MSPRIRIFFSVAALSLLLLATFPAVFASSLQPAGNRATEAYTFNCTFTIGYWKTHPESWPVGSLTVGGDSYTQDELLDILWSSPSGDGSIILAHQLIGAMLNVAQGADPSATGGTIAAANDWLTQHPIGSNPRGAARNVGIGYSQTLDAYNNGNIGPGHCDSNPPATTPTPAVSPIPTMRQPLTN